MWTPPASGAGDHRWPSVDRTLDRQPWDRVRDVLRGAGVPDVAKKVTALRRYVELLLQWNRSVSNLISKNDEERVVVSHLLPSIEPIGWLKSRNLLNWCDLGSGGGFPAIPLALCGVGQRWDLVESRRTKCLFLQRAVSELGLTTVRVLVARIEDLVADAALDGLEGAGASAVAAPELGPPSDTWAPASSGDDDGAEAPGHLGAEEIEGWSDDEPRPRLAAPFDGFTSRATMALAPTLGFATSIVRPGGEVFLWKGSRLEAELAAAGNWRGRWAKGEVRPLTTEYSVVANLIRTNG